MNSLISFGKQLLVRSITYVPLVNKYHRFRNRADVIADAVVFLEQSLARGALSSNAVGSHLRWLGIDLVDLPQAIVSVALSVLSRKYPAQEDVQLLEEQLKALSPFDLPCQQWLRLNELFCFRGRFPLAHICREHARQLAIRPFVNKDYRPPISWINSIAAALEGGECNNHNALDQMLKKARIKEREATKWHLLLSALNGEQVLESERAALDNTSYYEFLRSKRIAVVGPAFTELSDAEEIDSSEIVVRLNHSFSGKGVDSIHKGLRTDVSYFNGEQTSALVNDMKGTLPSEITWACFKGATRAFDIQSRNTNKNCRSMVMFNAMTFHGSYNLAPLVAMDLALSNCLSIKIFHTDLMLSSSRYSNYFPKSLNHNSNMMNVFLISTVDHDPVLQYRTLHRLWRNKKISGDERFENVMSMGLDSYIKALESAYSTKD